MKEILELRIPNRDAERYLPKEVGTPSGLSRALSLPVEDPLVEKLRAVEAEFRAHGTTLFTRCEVHRRYTPRELEAADFLLLSPWPFFMPSGEECGTLYDESSACQYCGAGARQLNELHLELGRIPKSRDFATTPGFELVVSSRLAEALRAHHLSGYELRPVLSPAGRRPSTDWFQLMLPHAQVEVAPPSVFGTTYLAPEPDWTQAHCPRGHFLGMRLLSPLHAWRSSLPDSDWASTRQLLGLRQGLFRPHPLLLISQRLYRLLKQLKLRPLSVEVAHLV